MAPANKSFYQTSTPVGTKHMYLSSDGVHRLSVIPNMMDKSFTNFDDASDFQVCSCIFKVSLCVLKMRYFKFSHCYKSALLLTIYISGTKEPCAFGVQWPVRKLIACTSGIKFLGLFNDNQCLTSVQCPCFTFVWVTTLVRFMK